MARGRGGASHRPEQVGEQVRAVLAEALLRGEVRDPRVTMVTVSGVEVTRDLGHATVRVVPHGDEAEIAAAVEALQRAAGFLRRLVAGALTTRTVPELHFVYDRGWEHAQRIDQLLAGLKREEEAS
jgi:ribosome-binding factor A